MNADKERKLPPNQRRITPRCVLDPVQEFMRIVLDPCWNEYALTDPEFMCDGVDADGLAADWGATVAMSEISPSVQPGGVFLNYVWNNPTPWIAKAAAEHKKHPHLDILVWGPLYPETEASSYIWNYARRMCFWGTRMNHPAPPIDFDGNLISGGVVEESSGSMWPAWLAYFGPRTAVFEDVFRPHGNVVWGWNEKS